MLDDIFSDDINSILNDCITRGFDMAYGLESAFPIFTDFIKSEKYKNYGDDFVQRLADFGCTEMPDDKLILHPWVKEFANGVGDLRNYHVLTTGNAQCGKSLINTLFMVDFLTFVNVNVLWFYPTKTQVDNLVPGLFGKVVRSYVANVERFYTKKFNKDFNLINKNSRNSNSNFQVGDATAFFRYASTSAKDNTDMKRGLATVGGSASSITANILFIDERSQIAPEALGTLFRRLDASRIGGLIREIGTPGSGLGIEYAMEQCDYHFYPHVDCELCQKSIPLSPKGCLLRPTGGKYLSITGRPQEWFYKDKNDKVISAFFACPECETEITKEQRLAAYFKCLRTKLTYQDYKAFLPDNIEDSLAIRQTIAFHLSPLLRDTNYNLAAHIVNEGLNSESTKDYSQQMLGFPSENDTSRITKSHLYAAQKNKFNFKKKHTVICAGIDQGRGQDWLYICKYYIQGFEEKNGHLRYIPDKIHTPVIRLEMSHREVVYCGSVERINIPTLLDKYEVDIGFIDNEPDIPDAYELCQYTCLKMVDQRKTLGEIIKPIKILGGSLEIEGYGIKSDYFKDALLNGYLNNLVSIFPFDINDRTPVSISRHLCSCEKDLDDQWLRPRDKVDDMFFAGMFCEAAVFHWMESKFMQESSTVSWYLDL